MDMLEGSGFARGLGEGDEHVGIRRGGCTMKLLCVC